MSADAARIDAMFKPKPRLPPAAEGHNLLPLHLGNVPIPRHLETRHCLLIGTTGAGKSQQLYATLTEIRSRHEPVILIDHSAEFLQRYYRPSVDLIFNPFDERSVGWSPFNEIRRTYDFIRLAKALVPDLAGDAPNQDWQRKAQVLLANILEKLWFKGKNFRNNTALLKAVSHIPLFGKNAQVEGTLQNLLLGTSSARLFECGPNSENKALTIPLDIINDFLMPLKFLKDGSFSMTDHVKSFEDGKIESWLFLSYTDASYAAVSSLFSIMVSCAIQSGLELTDSHDRRFFFILDEFASLKDKVDAIDDALTKLRKRGGVVYVSVQSSAQVERSYSKIGAQILFSCFGNVLMLRVADDETAEKCSALIGDRLFPEESFSENKNLNAGGQDNGQSSGQSTQNVVRRTFLGSVFYGLPDLHGIVRIAGVDTVFPTTITPSRLPLVCVAEETMTSVMLSLD